MIITALSYNIVSARYGRLIHWSRSIYFRGVARCLEKDDEICNLIEDSIRQTLDKFMLIIINSYMIISIKLRYLAPVLKQSIVTIANIEKFLFI